MSYKDHLLGGATLPKDLLPGLGGAGWHVPPQRRVEPAPRDNFALHIVSEHPPLAEDQRGLIISSPVKLEGSAIRGSGGLDQDELRFSLLLWDRLDYPSNNAIAFDPGAEADFLQKAGVLQRTRVQFSGGGSGGQIMLQSHRHAFHALDEAQPGRWSLGRGVNSISVLGDELEEGRGILFELHQALPIPDRDVPLEDVLEFKAKRRDELLALRHHLERIYQTILAAPDRPLARSTEMAALDRALADHSRTAKETGLPLKLSTLGAKLDVAAVGLGLAAGTAATVADMPLMTAFLAGVGATGLRVFGSIGLTAGLKDRKSKSPFEYVSSIERNLY